MSGHNGISEHSRSSIAFDFVIMAGAFVANDPDLARLYDCHGSYDLPSIHIIGRSDFVVPSEYSRKVAAKFKNPLVLEHNGGHVVAGTPLIRKRVASFLEERTRRR
jgi:pimeloyl-ACP methyl ester carboxylesterase